MRSKTFVNSQTLWHCQRLKHLNLLSLKAKHLVVSIIPRSQSGTIISMVWPVIICDAPVVGRYMNAVKIER